MNERDFDELSAGAALNALSGDERRAFEEHLAQHPEHAGQAAADTDTVAALAPPVPPPAHVRADLLARIADTPQGTPVDAGQTDAVATGAAPATGRTRRWFVLAASVVLLAALGFGATVIGQQLTRPAAVIALEQIDQAPDVRSATVALADGGEATAYWSATIGQAVLVADDLPRLTADQTFELWFVRDAGPVSAGTFDASGAETTALLTGAMHAGDVIAVTVEPAGGSPTGLPTTDPILAIPTA